MLSRCKLENSLQLRSRRAPPTLLWPVDGRPWDLRRGPVWPVGGHGRLQASDQGGRGNPKGRGDYLSRCHKQAVFYTIRGSAAEVRSYENVVGVCHRAVGADSTCTRRRTRSFAWQQAAAQCSFDRGGYRTPAVPPPRTRRVAARYDRSRRTSGGLDERLARGSFQARFVQLQCMLTFGKTGSVWTPLRRPTDAGSRLRWLYTDRNIT